MLLSPPNFGSPQVTTEPSVRMAAKEHQEDRTCCTCGLGLLGIAWDLAPEFGWVESHLNILNQKH